VEEEEEVESPTGDPSHAKEDDCVSSKEDKGNQEKTGVLSTLVPKGVTSQEYDTPILALLEGNNYKGAALKKKKMGEQFFCLLSFFSNVFF
jgi:hypothetical protein